MFIAVRFNEVRDNRRGLRLGLFPSEAAAECFVRTRKVMDAEYANRQNLSVNELVLDSFWEYDGQYFEDLASFRAEVHLPLHPPRLFDFACSDKPLEAISDVGDTDATLQNTANKLYSSARLKETYASLAENLS